MSAPSLYTYFPSVSHLITELIVQSFGELEAAVRNAVDAAAGAPLEERLSAGPRAYRMWALSNPQQFNLVFFDQVAGYAAPPEGPTVAAQEAIFGPMVREFADAHQVDPAAVASPGEFLDAFLGWWGSFHGLVALEANHHLDWVDAEAVFEKRLLQDVANIVAGSRT